MPSHPRSPTRCPHIHATPPDTLRSRQPHLMPSDPCNPTLPAHIHVPQLALLQLTHLRGRHHPERADLGLRAWVARVVGGCGNNEGLKLGAQWTWPGKSSNPEPSWGASQHSRARQGWKPLLEPCSLNWYSICASMSCKEGTAGLCGWLWYQPTRDRPRRNRTW